MTNIKAAFFDVDGTLTCISNKKIPNSTFQALERLHKKGIKIFICSGRHLLDIKHLNLPPFDGYIAINGACCVVDDKVIYKNTIPSDDIERLIEWQHGPNKFPCVLETEDGVYLNFINENVEIIQQHIDIRTPKMCTFDEWSAMARSGIEQMLCFFGPEHDEKIIKEVLPGCTTQRWCDFFSDVIAAGSDKAKGIDIIANHFGFKIEETMAFGDGGNDISMLSHAGIGVAMGDADENVKAAADYITESVENDGILKALCKFGILS
jgi:Cof subfamily protein (haloacid dehalogenase superfamily)